MLTTDKIIELLDECREHCENENIPFNEMSVIQWLDLKGFINAKINGGEASDILHVSRSDEPTIAASDAEQILDKIAEMINEFGDDPKATLGIIEGYIMECHQAKRAAIE